LQTIDSSPVLVCGVRRPIFDRSRSDHLNPPAIVTRALNLPHPARVLTGAGGVPVQVDGRAVELVRESWLVEDRWWAAQPLRRRYWEVVTTSGRNVVVFHDLAAERREPGSGWFAQGS
jgi:hypothetical protein